MTCNSDWPILKPVPEAIEKGYLKLLKIGRSNFYLNERCSICSLMHIAKVNPRPKRL